MKKFIFLFSAMLFASVFSFAASKDASSTFQKQEVKSLKECNTFSATLSCGIEVSVTACNVSFQQVASVLLYADDAFCNQGATEVRVRF